MFSLLRRTAGLLKGTCVAHPVRGQETRRSNAGVRVDPQYCRVLASGAESTEDEQDRAWRVLEKEMALVPGGKVCLASTKPEVFAGEGTAPQREIVSVKTLYMDRLAVTNADFARFVETGAYSSPDFWPRQILPLLLTFVDSTGLPGPRYWSRGAPPPGKELRPVVGVSWYEAYAYAAWAGKRLPLPSEWQRSAIWFDDSNSGEETRYPWGNAFDPKRANIAQGSRGETVPVDMYHEGCTPNGIHQLVGNTWEWVADLFECRGDRTGLRFAFSEVMGEIRGGAFDTYFGSHGTAQFRSGQPLLHRGLNVGFRCCVGAEALQAPPDSLSLLTSEHQT
jgi:iron(II)-dependent oxidoreductase